MLHSPETKTCSIVFFFVHIMLRDEGSVVDIGMNTDLTLEGTIEFTKPTGMPFKKEM